MSTADELRELREVAWKLFGVKFEGDITGHPAAAAALIQAHALHRLADALAPLERIAGALEANRARGEEPATDIRQEEARQFAEKQQEELTQATAWQDLPIRIGKGWVHGYTPAATGLRRREDVKVYDPSISEGWKWAQACEVTNEDLWAPKYVDSSPVGREVTLQRRPASTHSTPETPAITPQEPPQPASATLGGHPLDQGGWIRSRVPTEEDGDDDGEVKVASPDGADWQWLHWQLVALGQPWARANAEPVTAPQPLPAHIAYPESEGWVHDRVPGPEDADMDGDVKIAAKPASYIPWSHVVPGQPWRHTLTP